MRFEKFSQLFRSFQMSCSQFQQHFTRRFCANILSSKKLQSQTVSRKKSCKTTLLYEKAAHKMLMKLTTPGRRYDSLEGAIAACRQ